jgi:hypothetical protein
VDEVREGLKGSSRYELYGLLGLHAGMRLGEMCTEQRAKNQPLIIDRQKLRDGTISVSKTSGPVMVPEWLLERYESYEDILPSALYKGLTRGNWSGLWFG